MKKTFFHSLLKRFALLALAAGTVFATSVSLTACGGGGGDEARGTITYRQFVNGLKVIYLQAGSGFVLKGDPNLVDSGTQAWGYAYPASLGLQAMPGAQYQASFFGLVKPEDEESPLKGQVMFYVGFGDYTYSNSDGFTSFLGFPSGISPQLTLSGPLELTLDFDTRMWKTHIPDGSTLKYNNSSSNTMYTFSEEGGSATSTNTKFAQDRSGSFDILQM